MNLALEQNYVAYSAIKEGQIVSMDFSHSTKQCRYVAAVTPSTKAGIVGIATCAAAAGDTVSVQFFEYGKIVRVLMHETVTAGAQVAIDASGNLVVDDSTSGEVPLPLFICEAATLSADAICQAVISPIVVANS